MLLKEFARVLLITDAVLCKDARGASQTLYNIFEPYDPDSLLLYVPKNKLRQFPISEPLNKHVLAYTNELIPFVKNRLGKLINHAIAYINTQWLVLSATAVEEQIRAFRPDALLVIPTEHSSILVASEVLKKFDLPLFVYYMDDWLPHKADTINILNFELLRNAKGWIMISENLEETFKNRHFLNPPSTLILHNPVKLSGGYVPEFEVEKKHTEAFTIAYAGSIWPMHFDALEMVAKAVYQLRTSGNKIKLVVYTPQEFWNTYQAALEDCDTVYGGCIQYSEIHQTLAKADLLLVTSSFTEENRPFTSSSVQTKITDYMRVGKPIVSIGPAYSACNQFIKKHDIGFTIETASVEQIKNQLLVIRMHDGQRKAQAEKAYEVLKTNFTQEIALNNLTTFFQSALRNHPAKELKVSL